MRDLPTSRTPARLPRTTLVLGCALALTLVPGFVQAQVPARHNTEVSLPHPATIRDLIQPMLIDSVEELAAWIQDGATVGQCSIADNILHCECIAYESEELGTISIGRLSLWPADGSSKASIILEHGYSSNPSLGEFNVHWMTDINQELDERTNHQLALLHLPELSEEKQRLRARGESLNTYEQALLIVDPTLDNDPNTWVMGSFNYVAANKSPIPQLLSAMDHGEHTNIGKNLYRVLQSSFTPPPKEQQFRESRPITLSKDASYMRAERISWQTTVHHTFTKLRTKCAYGIRLEARSDNGPGNTLTNPKFTEGHWSVSTMKNEAILGVGKKKSMRAERPIDQSGWLPPRLRTSTDNIELGGPAYYFEPLTMGIAPALSLGNWYGGQLHLMRPSQGQDIWKREWMEVTLGYDPGEDDTPLVWSAIGRANLGDSKTHVSTSLEAGEDLVWSAARLDREAWSRSWRQDRVGLALHQDGLFLQLYGIQDQAIVEGQENTLEGGLDLATRVPMSERLHIDVLMRERSGRPDTEPAGMDSMQSDVFRHRFQGAVSLGGNHGDRRKAWADWMAGTLIESEVSRESNARLSTSTGNALLAASAGLEFEGRFEGRFGDPITHRISPQIDLFATPFGFEKQPDASDEDADDTLAWLIGAVHLKQSLKKYIDFDFPLLLEVPVSLWGATGQFSNGLWSVAGQITTSSYYGGPKPAFGSARIGLMGPLTSSSNKRTDVDASALTHLAGGFSATYWSSTLDPLARNLLGLSSFQQPTTPATHILVRDTFEAASSAASPSRIWSHGGGIYFGSPSVGFELGSTLYYTPTTNAYGGSASVQLAPRSSWPGRAGWSISGMAGYNKPSEDPRELMFLLGLSVPMAW